MSYTNSPIICSDQNELISSTAYHYIIEKGDTLRICTPRTPSSSSDTGYPGEICWDTDYIYVCTATDTWKRVALATF